jgi:hypothetical protein
LVRAASDGRDGGGDVLTLTRSRSLTEFTQGYATYASEYDSTVRLRVRGLHVRASNIAYWFSKKVRALL